MGSYLMGSTLKYQMIKRKVCVFHCIMWLKEKDKGGVKLGE